ncbi:hypothetical protein HPP92_019633 [Vanilla planifolia]|uniref:Uncharacterized protein n=1 Tax=Vanilla planifolia TaxID=51239 RepID=A0A835Q0Y1_VANPL|nr:hypothetical protein HPP92_019633 [Vanilla planifolia]
MMEETSSSLKLLQEGPVACIFPKQNHSVSSLLKHTESLASRGKQHLIPYGSHNQISSIFSLVMDTWGFTFCRRSTGGDRAMKQRTMNRTKPFGSPTPSQAFDHCGITKRSKPRLVHGCCIRTPPISS